MDELDESLIDRRAAIKKAVAGAAVAGVVWAAPKVEGLSLRPNYAAASSHTTELTSLLVTSGAAVTTFTDCSAGAGQLLTAWTYDGTADVTGTALINGGPGSVVSVNVQPPWTMVNSPAAFPFAAMGPFGSAPTLVFAWNCA